MIDIIENGYKIPFITTPPHAILNNNMSAKNEPEFVKEAIKLLIKSKRVEICKYPPRIVNPLSVSIASSGKKRLILDLSRLVNNHVYKEKTKYEDIKIALKYMKPGCFMYKFDLTAGYHHISIFKPHHEFLGFQ